MATTTPATGASLDASQSTLSPNFANYIYNYLNKGMQAANLPYQEYTGDRFAGPTSLQNQGFQGLGALTQPSQFGQATSAYSSALQPGGQYDASNAGSVANFMNPYQQNVTDINKREAIRSDAMAHNARSAQAVGAGAFGGSRQGLQEAEAARNLSTQLGDIQAKGSQSAFDTAMAAMQNQRGAQLTGAQGLGALGTQVGASQLNNIGAQLAGGATQQGLAQQPFDFAYQQWQQSNAFPQTQAENMMKLTQGLPLAANRYTSGTAGDNIFNSLLSGGLGGLSLLDLINK